MKSNSAEDEAQLLAALGSTTASASAYEDAVLLDAQLRLAPRISLPASAAPGSGGAASSSLAPCGEERPSLPDLSSLVPSTGGAPAVSPVLAVLARTRDALRSALRTGGGGGAEEGSRRREVDQLKMKEQILLTYLADVAGIVEGEGSVIPQNRVDHGRKRRRASGTADNYYGNVRTDNGQDGSAKQRLTENKEGKETNGKNAAKPLSATSRLNRIKNGEQMETAPRRSLKRQTMMSMKSQLREENGLSPLKSMAEVQAEVEAARRRREERRKRRRKRQRAMLGIDGSDEDEAEPEWKEPEKVKGILKKRVGDEENNPAEEKKHATDRRIESAKGDGSAKTGVRWAISKEDPPSAKPTQDQAKPTHTKVFCPICQLILAADEGGSPDEFLAKHVAECQKASHARSGGRTLRRRKRPTVVDRDIETESHAPSMDATTGGSEVGDPEIDTHASDPGESEGAGDEARPDDTDPVASGPPAAVDDIDEIDYEDRVDDWAERGLARMRSMSERDAAERPPGARAYEGGLELPAWVNDRLFPYQRTGVRWMWELHGQGAGGVVGDEMGLGKTVQVSAFLGAMAMSRLLDSVLILAPATMLSHWLSELAVWAPGLRRILVHRSAEADGVSRVVSRGMLRSLRRWLRKARADRVHEAIDEDDYQENDEHIFCGTGYVVVTTYENLRMKTSEWTDHPWSYVILDEGQKIRNPDADVTLACKRLRTPHRLLLSGTPIQNNLRELWSLFDFIFPGRLGTLPAFEAEFAEPIKRGGYSNASPMQVQLSVRCALVLKDLIHPYLLRRKKKDIKEVSRMPGKTEQVLFCRLSSKQRNLYEQYLASDEVTSVMRGAVQLLKAVTVLRKICNHPYLVSGPDGEFINDDEISSSSDEDFFNQEQLVDCSGKLHVLSKILPLWHKQGHKVIIFTQWKKMLDIIERFTNQKGWKYARMDGNTLVSSRQKLVDNFNNTESGLFLMLMTTKTGGVGLNITGASRVLLYDPDWNPATDAQARERAWRFGQKNAVTVYRLITAGTIEEKIYQRQIFKTALTNQILQDPKQKRLFSQKHLKDLFTLNTDTSGSTETCRITKGGGVVDMKRPDCPSRENNGKQQTDNKDTLDSVMKTKGLCGVFDHDFIEDSSSKKTMSVLEMEDNARKVALEAALALKESAKNQNRFEPTWTGSNETKHFGTGGMASSGSLLANLQNKRMQIASGGESATLGEEHDADTKKYSALLLRIRKYIRRITANGDAPTTRDILAEFKDVQDDDAAIFKRMLKSVAVVKNGRWTLQGNS